MKKKKKISHEQYDLFAWKPIVYGAVTQLS